MTQPPSPSAAALALADWMRSYFLPRGPWAHPDNRLDVATKLQEFADDAVAFATQAVAAERGKRFWLWRNRNKEFGDHWLAFDSEYPTLDGGDPAVLGEPEYSTVAERAKPAASDDITQLRSAVSALVLNGGSTDEAWELVAAALAERGERERERAAELMETFSDRILHFWDRPGGPPGNGYAPTTNADRAAAIRNQTGD